MENADEETSTVRLGRDVSMKEKWWNWHQKNPQIYEQFKKFTFQAIGMGHSKFSAWLIVNRIRWETMIATTGSDFKISNDYIAYYARQFMFDHPEHDGIFTTKTLKRS